MQAIVFPPLPKPPRTWTIEFLEVVHLVWRQLSEADDYLGLDSKLSPAHSPTTLTVASQPPSLDSSHPTPILHRSTILVAFQLLEFIKTGHRYADLISKEIRQVASAVVATNTRPTEGQLITIQTSLRQGPSTRSSAEPVAFDYRWATDKGDLRVALQVFYKDTAEFRGSSYYYSFLIFREPSNSSGTPTPERPSVDLLQNTSIPA